MHMCIQVILGCKFVCTSAYVLGYCGAWVEEAAAGNELLLVFPMNGTNLARLGRNRTARSTGNGLQFLYKLFTKLFELPLPSVCNFDRSCRQH